MGFVIRVEKHKGLNGLGDRRNVGNGVCHSTKKNITCCGVLGPVMGLCYCGDLGVRDQGHCQRDEGMEFVLAKEKNTSDWKWALTSWWGLNVMCYHVSRS